MSKTTSSESGKFPTPKLRISETIRVNCAAKLNLTFEILGRLPGGYHEIRTLFHSIDLEDVLRFSFMEAPELAIAISDDQSAPQSGIPIDNSNLIAIAAHAFAKKLSITNMRMLVSVRKSIPQGCRTGRVEVPMLLRL
jgi:4-diphosphocytidyl-2-C-methyl-D-erythritol kinase